MLEVITAISPSGKRKLDNSNNQALKEGTKAVPPLPRISNISDTEELGDLKATEIFKTTKSVLNDWFESYRRKLWSHEFEG